MFDDNRHICTRFFVRVLFSLGTAERGGGAFFALLYCCYFFFRGAGAYMYMMYSVSLDIFIRYCYKKS